ncbi:MAG: hypothetical protein WC838_06500 [Candidatus Margulisiibacteriota bacterium]
MFKIMAGPVDKPKNDHDLENGLKEAIQRIEQLLQSRTSTIVIAVAGGTCSGKTTQVAEYLNKHFGLLSQIYSLDHYYQGLSFNQKMKLQGIEIGWDQPEALDLERLAQDLRALKSGKAAKRPIYNMQKMERDGFEEVKPTRIILIEGLFALHSLLKDESDLKIFVHADRTSRLQRRKERDAIRTPQFTAQQVEELFLEAERMYERHVEPTRSLADILINN